ncbi:MAG: DUF1285 domain-containing protein [Rhodospirillaceae bacterium]|nr:MAG: DUF1285 domain-containing protein [Rhodospirillaceae bacterium]
MSNPDFSDLPLCGDLDMRIARDGTWFYRGSPIARKPLVKLFSTVLRREDDGAYWLVTPAERGRVQVDDAPFTAVELMASGNGQEQVLSFRTNVDDVVTVDARHPIRVDYVTGEGEPSPYVAVRDGLDALILRSVFYHLVELGEARRMNESEVFGVWSKGDFFPLGTLDWLETAP